jgi:DNA primase
MIFKDTFFVLGNRTIHLHQFPLPFTYYQQQFSDLKLRDKAWVSVKCCFHEDRQPSLRLNLNNGSFRCFGCGARGGSIIAFHCQRYRLTFVQTILALGGQCA